MKTTKLHFCDNNGHKMEELWVEDSFVNPVYDTLYYVCPMCNFTIINSRKAKGVITMKRSGKKVKGVITVKKHCIKKERYNDN